VAFPDHLDVMLTRLDTAPGFLLEGVKQVDPPGKSHRIDGPIRVPLELGDHHPDASPSKPLAGLRAGMRRAEPAKLHGEAQKTLPSVEEVRQQIGEGEEVEGVVVEDGERREGSEDKRDECNSDVASQCLLSWR